MSSAPQRPLPPLPPTSAPPPRSPKPLAPMAVKYIPSPSLAQLRLWDRRRVRDWIRQRATEQSTDKSTPSAIRDACVQSMERIPAGKMVALSSSLGASSKFEVGEIFVPYVAELKEIACTLTLQRSVRRFLLHKRAARQKELDDYREHVAQEILSTEERYVDVLTTMVDLLLNPLTDPKRDPIISINEVKVLFSDVAVIHAVHKNVLESLQKRIGGKHWDKTQKLGQIFITISSWFRVYTDYVKGYDQALKFLATLGPDSTFRKFYNEQIKKAPAHLQLGPFESLLIAPIQRIPRYKLLLLDLLRHTWEEHPDYFPLQEALKKVSEIADWVNENQHKFERMTKIIEYQQSISGLGDTQLVEASRQFLREGELMEMLGRNKYKHRFLILFNDMLVIADPKKNEGGGLFHRSSTAKTMQFLLKITLDTMQSVESLPDTAEQLNVFKINYVDMKQPRKHSNVACTLVCQTAEERTLWVNDLSQAIKAHLDHIKDVEDKKAKAAITKAEQAAAILSQKYLSLKKNTISSAAAAAAARSTSPESVGSSEGSNGAAGGDSPSRRSSSVLGMPMMTAGGGGGGTPGLMTEEMLSCSTPGGQHRASQSISKRSATFFSMSAMDKWKIAQEAAAELARMQEQDRVEAEMKEKKAAELAQRSKELLAMRYSNVLGNHDESEAAGGSPGGEDTTAIDDEMSSVMMSPQTDNVASVIAEALPATETSPSLTPRSSVYAVPSSTATAMPPPPLTASQHQLTGSSSSSVASLSSPGGRPVPQRFSFSSGITNANVGIGSPLIASKLVASHTPNLSNSSAALATSTPPVVKPIRPSSIFGTTPTSH